MYFFKDIHDYQTHEMMFSFTYLQRNVNQTIRRYLITVRMATKRAISKIVGKDKTEKESSCTVGGM